MIRLIYLLLLSVVSGFTARPSIGKSKLNSFPLAMSDTSPTVVVISPPGGVGEVAAVNAACLGSAVRWFVISGGSSSSVSLSPQALENIETASGNLELAGSSIENLKSGGKALSAVSKWCGTSNGLICTYDGSDGVAEFKAAIRLAVQEASLGVSGPQVAVLAADDDLDGEGSEEDAGISDFVGSLFSGAPKIPPSLVQALSKNACVVRHGQLFGQPESSPNFSPLVGGPRRDAVIAEEYTMRDVRVDPFVLSGNRMASSSFRACRHAVGEVSALIATATLPVPLETVSIYSQIGNEKVTVEKWRLEFERVKEETTSGKVSDLFYQEMIVDDTERLADWLATKWAPAVLRTYDIAAIRTGPRPVYAIRCDSGIVEIIWQELVDFQSVVVGRMILRVDENGITATRGAGDAKAGFGTISMKPLPGEEALVSRLAEAASQATEKGLARKCSVKVHPKKARNVEKAVSVPVTSLDSSGAVRGPPQQTPDTGPRKAGARRSTPRRRRGNRSEEDS
eukprot:scaffold1993_cov107-Cylindrotheca_fusiformis.AAC.5